MSSSTEDAVLDELPDELPGAEVDGSSVKGSIAGKGATRGRRFVGVKSGETHNCEQDHR